MTLADTAQPLAVTLPMVPPMARLAMAKIPVGTAQRPVVTPRTAPLRRMVLPATALPSLATAAIPALTAKATTATSQARRRRRRAVTAAC
jgi:hypothetical protein